MDIMLDLGRLREVLTGLEASLAAFDSAAAVNNDLEGSVGRPDERGELRGKVGEFESAWNLKRGKLSENLTGVRDQLASIVDGWETWDTDTAGALEASVSEQAAGTVSAVR